MLDITAESLQSKSTIQPIIKMKSFALIALFVAGTAANYGGYGGSIPAVRVEPISVSYASSAPIVSPYGGVSSAPIVSSYGGVSSAPIVSTYGGASSAPIVSSYGGVSSAPIVSSYGGVSSPSSYGSSYGGSTRSFVPITRFSHDIRGSEQSNLEFEAGNGIRIVDNTQVVQGRGGSYQNEYGQMVQSTASISKSGSHDYISPEGQHIHLDWVADENGYRATGAHLPTSPPIPEEIMASLRGSGWGSGK